MRRQRNLLGPQGMGGMVSLWGASSLVASVQTGTIALNASPNVTATITAVNTANAVIVFGGFSVNNATANTSFSVYVTLTNATTVTATTVGTGNDRVVAFTVIEFMPGVIRSVQGGTITLAGVASNTATITSVNTAKSYVAYLGMSTNVAEDQTLPRVVLTNATTVTATRAVAGAGGGTTASYQVMELF